MVLSFLAVWLAELQKRWEGNDDIPDRLNNLEIFKNMSSRCDAFPGSVHCENTYQKKQYLMKILCVYLQMTVFIDNMDNASYFRTSLLWQGRYILCGVAS